MKKSPKSQNKPILSIIILNYNSQSYLYKCLLSLSRSQTTYPYETIVVDNNSTDNSIELSQKIDLPNTQYLLLHDNPGFAAGNNQGVKLVHPHSKYTLFLNPDTIVDTDTIQKIIAFMESHHQADAATCFVRLAKTGQMQPECHRGFPTPVNAFWHFFGFGLPKLFPHSVKLNGYYQGYQNMTETHQVDACVGAFFLIKKTVGQKIGWWNESYFFYGEDLDFCYKLKEQGFKLFFYPHCQITHFQGVSSGIVDKTASDSSASRSTKIRSAIASTNAMLIFYQQNLLNKYPKIIYFFVVIGVNFLKLKRVIKAKFL